MRWLGRPKEYASHASAVTKLATKEQVERLFQMQANGEEVHLFGCMVNVSSFNDNKGQEDVLIAISSIISRKTVKIPLYAPGVHKQATTIAGKENRDATTVEKNTQQHIKNAQNAESSRREPSIYVVMNSTLNILQANFRESSGVQDALYNDSDIWEFDVILIQEPNYQEFDRRIRKNTHDWSRSQLRIHSSN